MMYLSKTVTIYVCDSCGQTCDSASVRADGYGDHVCPDCGCSVKSRGERDAEYWSVAVYEVDRAYGGPEEGGWCYDCGILESREKIRVFVDYDEARAYADALWAEVPEEDKRGESRVAVCGWTDRLPEHHWPQTRPRYC